MKHPTLHTHTSFQKVAFWALVSVLFFVCGLYVYFISLSVVHIVLRQEISVEVLETEARIGSLEARYLATSEGVKEERASELSLVPITDRTYVAIAGPDTVTLNR